MRSKVLQLITTLILIISLLTGCTSNKAQKETMGDETAEENYIPVEVEKSVKKDLMNVTTYSGKVYAQKEVMVMPMMPGKVTSVMVNVGDRISKGDVLFTLDKEDIEKQIEQANAAYESALANYNMTKEQIENAKANYERAKQLYEQGIISKVEFEKAELAASDSSLEAAKAGLNQAELAYKQAMEALDNTVVEAPISGIVSTVNIDTGEIASSGQPALTIVDMDTVYVQINVPENQINNLSEGQEVIVRIPSALDKEFKGKIDSISPAVDQRTQLYPVKIYISNEDHIIKPGMLARIEVHTDLTKDVIAVRSEAVIEKDGEKIVYVVEDDKAVEKKVEVGLDTGDYIQITSGLNEGERVIVKGQHYVEDKSQVKVVRGE